jgi:type IV secretion system protein VirD4
VAWQTAFALALLAIFWFPCLIIPLGLVILLALAAKRATTSDSYGSARFAETADIRAANLLGPTGLILGRSLPDPARLWKAMIQLFTAPWRHSLYVCQYMRAACRRRSEPGNPPLIRLNTFVHGLVCAPPGAGKGVGFVLTNLLSYPGSCLVIDPKGENYRTTSSIRRRQFRNRIVRLDPFGVCGKGSQFNPLDLITLSPHVVDQCAALADALVVQTGHETDPHWNEAARIAILAGILYVVVYAAPPDRTLNAVADIITDPDGLVGMINMMQDKTGELASLCIDPTAYRLLQRYGNAMSSWQGRELSSILSSVGRHLSWLHSQPIEEHLSASSFDPRDLVRGDMTVYLVLPPKYLTTHSRLLRLWVASIYGAITDCGPQEEREVLLLLDEAASLGPMPSLFQAITLGRGYGIRAWLILQSLGQLKTLFPKDGEHQTIDASIDHKIFFGIRDFATAESLSNYLGQATIEVTSRTTSRGSSTTGSFIGAIAGEKDNNYSHSTNSGTSRTTSEVGRKLLMPDEILQLPADAAIILARESPPILATLARFYETPELASALREIDRAG